MESPFAQGVSQQDPNETRFPKVRTILALCPPRHRSVVNQSVTYQGLADIARHVIGCYQPQAARVVANVLDDNAGKTTRSQ